MSANKWQKRRMKLKGGIHQIFSLVLLRYSRLNMAKLKGQIKQLNIKQLHVGCGDVLLKDWLNIKFERREEYGKIIDKNGVLLLNYNLLKIRPVENETIQFIAGSHFIEHLDLNQGIEFLKKAYNALQRGGVIRLSCPDLELYAKNYVTREKQFFDHPKVREWCAFKNAKTPGEIFIAKAYDSGGSHKWFYDFESLKHVLECAGFGKVKKCGRLEGVVPDL